MRLWWLIPHPLSEIEATGADTLAGAPNVDYVGGVPVLCPRAHHPPTPQAHRRERRSFGVSRRRSCGSGLFECLPTAHRVTPRHRGICRRVGSAFLRHPFACPVRGRGSWASSGVCILAHEGMERWEGRSGPLGEHRPSGRGAGCLWRHCTLLTPPTAGIETARASPPPPRECPPFLALTVVVACFSPVFSMGAKRQQAHLSPPMAGGGPTSVTRCPRRDRAHCAEGLRVQSPRFESRASW